MAKVIVTIRIMPVSPDEDLSAIEKQALQKIEKFAGKADTRTKIVPIAFGLSAIDITFIMDESLGSPDPLEPHIIQIPGVNSFQVMDCRRAIG